MSIQLKLVSIKKENSQNSQNSQNSINKYVLIKKLCDINDLDSNTLNLTNGSYKIKLRKIIKYIILEKIKELECDKDSLDKINDSFNNDIIKFICGSETIKDDDEIFMVEDKKIIYIFTNDDFSQDILCKTFFKFGKDLTDKKEKKLSSLLEEKLDEDHILEKMDMDNINEELMNEFKDNDFIFLLNILKNRPELFDKLYQYLSSGDIVDQKEFDEFTFEESEFNFEKEFISLLNLNLDESENTLKKVLMYFKGHLNLSLRFILNQKKIE
jgi:hypothetical protein